MHLASTSAQVFPATEDDFVRHVRMELAGIGTPFTSFSVTCGFTAVPSARGVAVVSRRWGSSASTETSRNFASMKSERNARRRVGSRPHGSCRLERENTWELVLRLGIAGEETIGALNWHTAKFDRSRRQPQRAVAMVDHCVHISSRR
jgi:hypothetical protein